MRHLLGGYRVNLPAHPVLLYFVTVLFLFCTVLFLLVPYPSAGCDAVLMLQDARVAIPSIKAPDPLRVSCLHLQGSPALICPAFIYLQ